MTKAAASSRMKTAKKQAIVAMAIFFILFTGYFSPNFIVFIKPGLQGQAKIPDPGTFFIFPNEIPAADRGFTCCV